MPVSLPKRRGPTFFRGGRMSGSTALTVNIVCAIASAVGLLLAASMWRTLRQDGASGLLWERLNAEALSGMLISALFTVAVLFNTVSLGSLSTCSRA